MSFWTTCNEEFRGDTQLRKIVGAPPRVIGRYRVIDILGQGGMGIVYRCAGSALGSGDLVALKLLKDPGADVNTLMREALLLARLEHPNVARFRDFGFHEKKPYVVTRLYPAGNLMTWLKQHKRPWSKLMPVLISIAQGLAYIHQHGVLHLDVKPHNILMDGDGEPKISDFGISVPSQQGDRTTENPAGTARAYTRRYASPEQLRGGKVDTRSDQYSFCRMIELDILGSAHTAPPRQLQRVLTHGCSDHPDNRFATMEGLIAALQQPRIHRSWWIAAASLLSLVVGAGAVAAQPLVDEFIHPCQVESSAAAKWEERRSQTHATLQEIGAAQEWMHVEPFLDRSVETMEASRERLCDRTVFVDRTTGEFQRIEQCLKVHDWVIETAIDMLPDVQHEHLPGVVETLERLTDEPKGCFQARTSRAYLNGLDWKPRVQETVENLIRAELLAGFGDYPESLRLATTARDMAGIGDGVDNLRGNAELQLGRTKLAQADFQSAMASFQIAEEIALKIHSHPLEMDALNGMMEVSRDDTTISRVAALELLGRAEQIAKSEQSSLRVATFLKNRGGIHLICGEDPQLALRDFEKALRLLDNEETHNQQLRAALQSNIAAVLMKDDPRGAVDTLSTLAKQMERSYGPTHPTTLICQHNYGEGLLELGRHAEALAVYQSIIEAESVAATPARLLVHTLPSAIFSALSSGQLDRAASLAGQLDQSLPKLEGIDRSVALQSIASYFLTVGGQAKSSVYACEAAWTYRNLRGPAHLPPDLRLTLGDTLVLSGALDEAADFYRSVLVDAHEVVTARAKLGLGAVMLPSDPEAAAKLLHESAKLLEKLPARRLYLARAYVLGADASAELGRAEDAAQLRRQALATYPGIHAITKFSPAAARPSPPCIVQLLEDLQERSQREGPHGD